MCECVGSKTPLEVLLDRPGSGSSFDILMDAARSLSDEDLIALESDLELFEETGLIGVQMSGLLKLILQAPLAA